MITNRLQISYLKKIISFLFIIKISKRIEMYTKHLTIYQGLRLVNFFLKTAKWIEFTLTTGIFNSFNIQNSCNICFQCVFVCMYVFVLMSFHLRASPVQNDTRDTHECTGQRCYVEDIAAMPLPVSFVFQFPSSSTIFHLRRRNSGTP